MEENQLIIIPKHFKNKFKIKHNLNKAKKQIRIYWAYFKLKFLNEIQYKVAALAGVLTQFAWGAMYIMLYTTFLKNGTANDYTTSQMCSYIWLHQAFLMMFNLWKVDKDIMEECETGNIAMELVKPVNLYTIWHSKTLGKKLAMTILRAIPILLICSLPILGIYKLQGPVNIQAFIFFIIVLVLSITLFISYAMTMYVCIMKTISSRGIITTFQLIMEFCSGAIIPIAFMPNNVITILKFTPFYYMQNVAFNVYNGYIANTTEILQIIIMQIVWIALFTMIGVKVMNKQLSKIVVQGG